MDEAAENYTRAYLGDQAEKFWKSDLGEYLITRIDSQEFEILDQLSTCNADSLIQLQERLAANRSIKAWFSELINDGQQARQEIEEQ